MILRCVHLGDGHARDVRIAGTTVTEVGPPGLPTSPDEQVIDLSGWLVLPAPAEPHAHLDKAFLAERILNPTGDLMGAINAMETHRSSITLDDTIERATRAVDLLVRNGFTALRTHADTTVENSLTSVRALCRVRDQSVGRCDIQVVALMGRPITGADGAKARALLHAAIEHGVDLVGGCPHLEPGGPAAAASANTLLLDIALDAGLGVDLHTDETLDHDVLGLEHLARRVIDTGFPHPVTASHCVSLGMQSEVRQREVARLVAEAGISIVALPHTNLYLQGRDHPQAMPRGLTAIRALHDAGVVVAAGADNLQDPFNLLGRGDAFETAALLVLMAHLDPVDAYTACSANARLALGLPVVAVAPGSPADLMALPAASVREAVAMAPSPRLVMKAGRVVSCETQARRA